MNSGPVAKLADAQDLGSCSSECGFESHQAHQINKRKNMSDEFVYTREELGRDLFLMVKAGLLDISIREDGAWLYAPSDKSRQMTHKEILEVIARLDDFE